MKLLYQYGRCVSHGRPRKGAWIEILQLAGPATVFLGRPRKGAWIEIKVRVIDVWDVYSRPRKGAWIEIGGSGIGP